MKLTIQNLLITCLVIFSVWQFLRAQMHSDNSNYYRLQDSINTATISELNQKIDRLEVDLSFEKEKRTGLEENYEALSNDYRELTNEEHHLNIVSAPDTLSDALLYTLAERYNILR